MSAAALYRRPPFLVGDEPAVLRYRRRFQARRRALQAGFGASVVAVALLLRAAGADGLLPAAAAFAALSSAFVVAHLAVGKRKWMKPVEAYEDGIAASEITALFCRRRFAAWEEVDSLDLRPHEGSAPTLVAVLKDGRRLESAPGEFDDKGVAAMRSRVERARADAAAQRAVFDAVGDRGEAGG